MTSRPSRNPYLFVVGCPRSGTTLLRRMLDAHPQLAMTPETHWIPDCLERRIGVKADGFVTEELVSHLLASPKFGRTRLAPGELESLLQTTAPLRYADFVRGFFDLYGRVEGKPLVGDKTPGYVRRMPLLNELFPEARFVHLIRDGRDVALSALGWRRASKLAARLPTWTMQPVLTAAYWWEQHVRDGRAAGESLGPDTYYEVRYEALIADPAGEAQSLCDFLGLPYDDAMVRYHEGRRRSEPGLSAKKAWLPPTQGLRDWRTQMPPEDVERFEAMVGELLSELGYARAVPRPSPAARELATSIRAALSEDRPKRVGSGRRRKPSKNPYVFVVGCPRSGTTLLQRLLDAHPELAVINETLWITREAEGQNDLTPEGLVTPELVARLFQYPRFRRLELPYDEVEALLAFEPSLLYRGFVSGIFDLYGQRRGKRLVGDKSPGYVREIARLHGLWPEAKFVHLLRDGRDIWLSVARWKKADRTLGQFATWAQDPVGTTALWWERSVRLGREAGAALGPALYREVRYEELVVDPARVCGDLCNFLALPYDDAMLRFHEGRTRLDPELTSKRAWLPPISGLRDWRAEMPTDDVERFEATAGELLEELGYPRVTRRPPVRAGRRAARIRLAFTEDARARGRALPGRWQA